MKIYSRILAIFLFLINSSLYLVTCNSAYAAESLSFIHSDHLGSTSLVTDENGNIISQQVYYPYGSTRLATNNLQLTTERKYTSQITDQDQTGLYYYNARYYNPVNAKFTQADTVQGPNRYLYVSNNPIIRTDPSGHADWVGDSGDSGSYYVPPPSEQYTIGPMPEGMGINADGSTFSSTRTLQADGSYLVTSHNSCLQSSCMHYQNSYGSLGERTSFGTPWGIAENVRNMQLAKQKGDAGGLRYYAGQTAIDTIGTALLVGGGVSVVRSGISAIAESSKQRLFSYGEGVLKNKGLASMMGPDVVTMEDEYGAALDLRAPMRPIPRQSLSRGNGWAMLARYNLVSGYIELPGVKIFGTEKLVVDTTGQLGLITHELVHWVNSTNAFMTETPAGVWLGEIQAYSAQYVINPTIFPNILNIVRSIFMP